MPLHLVVEVLQARDHHDRRRQPADDVAERGQHPAEPHRRVAEVEDVLELVDAEDQRHPLDGPHQLAQPLDHPLRRRGVDPRDDPAQRGGRAGVRSSQRRYFSTLRLDPRDRRLEVEQGLHQVEVDRGEPVVEGDPVGQARGPARRAPRWSRSRLAEPVEPRVGTPLAGPDSASGVGEPHQPRGLRPGSSYGLSSDSIRLFRTYRP